MSTIILVSVGTFQDYLINNIKQLLLLDFDVHVITNKKFFNKLHMFSNITKVNADELTLNKHFDDYSSLDKSWRGGFWHNTSKRFFLIYEYIKRNNITNVFHIENDVLLYSKLNYKFDNKLYLVMDSKDKCIPSIIYIPSYVFLQNLIFNYKYHLNDMVNLAYFYNNNKNIIKTFPIIDNTTDMGIYNENYTEFTSIFDGCAIGQYLGGIDPRNKSGDTSGFINECTGGEKDNPKITFDKYKFKWLKKDTYYFPHIEINNNFIPINNLHIHCKNLKPFMINNPCENKYITK